MAPEVVTLKTVVAFNAAYTGHASLYLMADLRCKMGNGTVHAWPLLCKIVNRLIRIEFNELEFKTLILLLANSISVR